MSEVVPPPFSSACALCLAAFRPGDRYRTVWRRGRYVGERTLGLTIHQACWVQLAPGDLTRVFAALERRLALPIAVVNGRRVERTGLWEVLSG